MFSLYYLCGLPLIALADYLFLLNHMRTPWIMRRMMVGSDEHLRALGALTLDFGAVDEALVSYIESFLAIATGREFDDLRDRLQGFNFSERTKSLRVVIRACSEAHAVNHGRLLVSLAF
jgi:hypothetical protein